MKSLIPLLPFVAALGLLACQGNDGPVAESVNAAEAVDGAALPPGANGMGWSSAAGSASFGPHGARALLRFACGDGSLRVTRLHPATPGATATLSFTGGGAASSLPMRAVARPGGPGESEWQGKARGDMARAVARAFADGGEVEVTLGGAPALLVPASPMVDAVLRRCAS